MVCYDALGTAFNSICDKENACHMVSILKLKLLGAVSLFRLYSSDFFPLVFLIFSK